MQPSRLVWLSSFVLRNFYQALDLKDLGVLLGIKDAKTKLASHSLRRGGATSLFNAGIDAMYIREWGRWSQDMWVTVYAQLSFDRQLELTKAFPSVM